MTGILSRFLAEWRMFVRVVRIRPFETDTEDGRSRERYRRIFLSTASSFGVRGVGMLLGLVSVPLVLGYLGKDQFGLWSMLATLLAWATLFDFGIANGLLNCLSRAYGRDDRADAARSVSTALVLLLGIAAALAVLLTRAVPGVPWGSFLATVGTIDDGTVRWSVAAALGTFVVALPLSIAAPIYAGYQRTYVANVFTLTGLLLGFCALLAGLNASVGLPLLVILSGSGPLIGSGLSLFYATGRAMPWLRLKPASWSTDAMRSLLRRSVPIFMIQVGSLAVNEAQPILLAHRCNLGTVAEYSVVIRLYIALITFVQLTTQSFVPSFREAFERGDREWARRSFRHGVRVRMLLALTGAGALVALGNPVLRIWLRREDFSFGPGVWLSLGGLLVAATWTTAYAELLAIMDRLWIQVALVSFNGAISIALTWVLAPRFGVLGVVVATGAVTALVFSWLLPALARPLVRSGRIRGIL